MSDEELLDILNVSRRNNEKKNLTGILIYSDGTFIQMLEGEHEELKSTYEIIIKDPRHQKPIKLNEGNTVERSFPDWQMGFKTINANELQTLKGYFDPKKLNIDEDGQHLGLMMMKTFVEANS